MHAFLKRPRQISCGKISSLRKRDAGEDAGEDAKKSSQEMMAKSKPGKRLLKRERSKMRENDAKKHGNIKNKNITVL